MGCEEKREKEKEQDLAELYCSPAACEILFVDLLFDEWISRLDEDEVMRLRKQLMGSDVGET